MDEAESVLRVNGAELRELNLALAVRIGVLSRLATAEIAPSQLAAIRRHLEVCEQLVVRVDKAIATA